VGRRRRYWYRATSALDAIPIVMEDATVTPRRSRTPPIAEHVCANGGLRPQPIIIGDRAMAMASRRVGGGGEGGRTRSG